MGINSKTHFFSIALLNTTMAEGKGAEFVALPNFNLPRINSI
jgi:hypothetical protein